MSPLRVLYEIVKWGFRLAPMPAFLFSTWVFMAEAIAGMPIYRAMVWGFFGLGSALWASYGVLVLIEKALEWTKEANEVRRVVGLLKEAQAAGHRWVKVMGLVNIWLEVQSQNASVRYVQKNYRLRLLKDAVSQGFIRANLGDNSFPDKDTPCDIGSAIEFFRQRDWYKVKPRQSGEVYRDERQGEE